MFSWYKNRFFPGMMNKNIGKESILQLRKRVLSNAKGNILELGIGTGTNLSLYPNNICEITAIDIYVRHVSDGYIKVNLINESACKMSFLDNTFDTVVSTFSLCSIDDLEAAFHEIFRVLKPGGQLLFLEHGKSKGKISSILQNVCNPLYNVFAFGCNINRSYVTEMQKCGFELSAFSYERAPIYPRLLTGYVYMGVAQKYNDGGC